MIEKIYNIECRLCYLTLRELVKSVPEDSLPKELSDDANIPVYLNPLIQKIFEIEGDNLKIIDLGEALNNSLNEKELNVLLTNEIIEKLKKLFTA